MRITIAGWLLLLLTLGACGSQGGSDRKQAAEALREGLAAHRDGDIEAAEEAYTQVLEALPENKFALFNLGLIAQTRGDNAEAEELYRRALDSDANFTPALYNLALVRTEEGAPEEAVELYRRVVAIAPENAAAHHNLGLLLIREGERKEGREELELALRLDPSLLESPEPETSP
ncbi:MAG: tetratricopeptide repeat protein [Actinomycetota bacterium]